MKRTQLYLPEKTHLDLAFIAQREEKSISQLVREILVEGIYKKKGLSSGKTLEKLASYNATAGPKDLSSKLDSYLYGSKK